MNNESYPRSNIETSKDVEMQRKESGESHSSEELQTKLTGILIETLYRFEGSERNQRDFNMHLENCTGKTKRKDENVKIQSRLGSASDCARI